MSKFEAKLVIHRQEGIQAILEALEAHDWSYPLSVEIKPFKGRRNGKMNNCMHKYCRMLAYSLNDAGIDFRLFLKPGYPVPWTKDLALDHIWRPVQKAYTGEESTREPSNQEYCEIYDIINRKTSEDHGVYVPWPSKETMGEKNGN